jgi:uncharacterized membrane protein YczE
LINDIYKKEQFTFMLSLEEVTLILQDRTLTEVSRRSGVAYLTVWRIAKGIPGNVSYGTVVKLSEYLEKKPGE